jgi:hypothetical protein
MPKYEFKVTVHEEGGVQLTPTDASEEVSRTATALDIIDSCRKVAADIERQMTLDTIAEMVSNIFPKPEATVSEKVSQALKERGISPE